MKTGRIGQNGGDDLADFQGLIAPWRAGSDPLAAWGGSDASGGDLVRLIAAALRGTDAARAAAAAPDAAAAPAAGLLAGAHWVADGARMASGHYGSDYLVLFASDLSSHLVVNLTDRTLLIGGLDSPELAGLEWRPLAAGDTLFGIAAAGAFGDDQSALGSALGTAPLPPLDVPGAEVIGG
jgi:hypothetical protein